MKQSELERLDDWIATHVMGFVWIKDNAQFRSDMPRGSRFKKGTRCLGPEREISPNLGWSKANGKEPLAPDWRYFIPAYHSNNDAALAVFDKCLDRLAFGAWIQKTPSGYAVCYAVNGKASVTAGTLPLAVCLFAKEIFGGKQQ